MFINEDHRRMLIEWISDEPFRQAKVVIAKSSDPIGNHYHLKKDEKFLLLSGKAISVQIGDSECSNIVGPHLFEVPAGAFHTFILEPGSILLGVATQPHDPEDEIRA